MTNLRNGAAPALLSRERILVGAPLLIGVVLAVGVGVGVLRPTLERVDVLEARLEDLQRQQRSLPELERRLVEAQTTLSLREQRQLVLLISSPAVTAFRPSWPSSVKKRARVVSIFDVMSLWPFSRQQSRPDGDCGRPKQPSLSQRRIRCKSWAITSPQSRCR